MNHILLPVDFSPASESAVPYAVDLAQKAAGHLILVHAFRPPILPPANIFTSREETEISVAAEMEQIKLEKLKQFAEEHVGNKVPVLTQCVMGSNPVEAIVDYIHDRNIALVVSGTSGAQSWTEEFKGTFSADLIRKCRVPVLVVPEHCDFKPFENMVYATDRRADETAFFDIMTAFAKMYQSHATFLHVEITGGVRHNPHPALAEFLKGANHDKLGTVEVTAADIETGLMTFVSEQNIDLIALSTQTHSRLELLFHRSLARKQVHHSKIPVLVFDRNHALRVTDRANNNFHLPFFEFN